MPSSVDICNLALSFLGDDACVASIDPPEESTQAQICARQYPLAVLALLEMHDWSFATEKARLTPLNYGRRTTDRVWTYCNGRRDRDRLHTTVADAHGWKHVYEVPSDCLRVISVEDEHFQRGWMPGPLRGAIDGALQTTMRFETGALGRKTLLYCDADHAVLTYVTRNAQPSLFPPLFVQSLAWYLAASMAGAIIKGEEGQKMAQNCLKEFSAFVSLAKTADANRQKKRHEFIPRWILMR